MEYIFIILVLIAVIITVYLPFLSKKSKEHDKPLTKKSSESATENVTAGEENIEKVSGEALYTFTLMASKKVCPCCECENSPSAVCCEVCGESI